MARKHVQKITVALVNDTSGELDRTSFTFHGDNFCLSHLVDAVRVHAERDWPLANGDKITIEIG